MILCSPTYKQQLKVKYYKEVNFRNWSNDYIETLQDCFENTIWDNMYGMNCSSDENVDVFTSYVNIAMDVVIPSKSVKMFPINKPWVTKELNLC